MGQALSKNILKYEFKYKSRKFIVMQKDEEASINGVRFDIHNITSIVINNNLPSRQKQLLVHKLITGRRIKDFNNKGKARMFLV